MAIDPTNPEAVLSVKKRRGRLRLDWINFALKELTGGRELSDGIGGIRAAFVSLSRRAGYSRYEANKYLRDYKIRNARVFQLKPDVSTLEAESVIEKMILTYRR